MALAACHSFSPSSATLAVFSGCGDGIASYLTAPPPPTQAPPEYLAPVAGGCRGPGGRGDVQSKYRNHVPMQAECQSFCDEEPSCVGYEFYGNTGECWVLGPGPWEGPIYWVLGTPRPTTPEEVDSWRCDFH